MISVIFQTFIYAEIRGDLMRAQPAKLANRSLLSEVQRSSVIYLIQERVKREMLLDRSSYTSPNSGSRLVSKFCSRSSYHIVTWLGHADLCRVLAI